MARTKRPAIGGLGLNKTGEQDPSTASQEKEEVRSIKATEEPKKHSIRGPSLPFQMVTRARDAQARMNNSEEHAPEASEPVSTVESGHPPGAPQPARRGRKGQQTQVASPGVSSTQDDAGEAEPIRRSKRVVEKKAAREPTPPVEPRSLIVVLRLPPQKLKAAMASASPSLKRKADGLETPCLGEKPKRVRRAKSQTVKDEEIANPSSSHSSPADTITSEEQSPGFVAEAAVASR